MLSRHRARGVFLVLFASFFGFNALRYQIGDFGHSGPGLFPLLVSGLLAVLGVVTIIQSLFAQSEPLEFNFRNIGLITGSLVGFVLISAYLGMGVAIVFLVFTSSLAGSVFSLRTAVSTTIVLILIAIVFEWLLGLNLRLL